MLCASVHELIQLPVFSFRMAVTISVGGGTMFGRTVRRPLPLLTSSHDAYFVPHSLGLQGCSPQNPTARWYYSMIYGVALYFSHSAGMYLPHPASHYFAGCARSRSFALFHPVLNAYTPIITSLFVYIYLMYTQLMVFSVLSTSPPLPAVAPDLAHLSPV